MSEQEFGSTPAGSEPTSSDGAGWQTTPPAGYAQQAPPPGYAAQPAAATGLSETTACTLAYVTFIPALIFLLMPPYNLSPKIKFHAIQELGLSVVWMALGIVWIVPILGWIIGFLGFIALLVCWVMCILKASQGGAFKLPVIGNFAAEQSGYKI